MSMIRIETAPALLLLLALNASSAAADNPGALAAPSEQNADAGPVDFFMQNVEGRGVHLAVPKVYLNRSQRNGKLDTFLFLDVVFPDMTPRDPIRRTVQEIVEDISKSLDEGKTLDQVNSTYKHREGTWFGDVRLSGGTPGQVADSLDYDVSHFQLYDDETEPGFRHYRRNTGNSVTDEELLIPDEEAATRSISLLCHSHSYCLVNTTLDDRIDLSYNIGWSNISQWRDLDAKVRSWVRGFVVDCFDGPRLKPGDKPALFHPCPF